jgi:hypothetical protein
MNLARSISLYLASPPRSGWLAADAVGV